MALDKITTGIIADDAITAAKLPANSVGASELADDAVDTAAIADNAVSAAKVAADVATQAELDLKATKVELEAARQDITILALREAVTENRVAYTSTNSFIDQFQDDSGIGTETNTDRNASEYIHTKGIGAFSNDANTVFLLHFDNNLTDSGSNGITFSNRNSATFNTTHKKYGTHSLRLTKSSSQYISTPDLESVDTSVTTPTTGAFTIEFWMMLLNADYSEDRWFTFSNRDADAGGVGDPGALSMAWNSTNNFNIFDGANNAIPGSSGDADVDEWHHYAMQRGSTYWTLYQDGIIRHKVTISGANAVYAGSMQETVRGNGNFLIGARSGSNTEYVDGRYDEMRYSNIARYTDTAANNTAVFTPNEIINPTGTMIGTANVPSSAQTKVSGVMLYKDNAGTATS